ncbi:MAG: RsiV family protein [Candidatus Xenobiia bacterium LiM19]
MRMSQGARWLIMAMVLSLAISGTEIACAQSFTWTLKTREVKEKDWSFKYTYPELSTSDTMMGKKVIVRGFNNRIRKDIAREEQTFLENLEKDKDSLSTSVASTYTVRCTIVGKTARYASFLFEHLDMRSNLAHPDFTYSTINWAADGKYLTLADLCTSQQQFLNKLSAESGRLLKMKLADQADNLQSDGWAPKAENFKHFCLSREGLKIYFEYYQLGPRPLGAPKITIPWSALEDLLSPLAKELLKH